MTVPPGSDGTSGMAPSWGCPRCQRVNLATARFCPSCGTPQSRSSNCPICAVSVGVDQAFCGHCGASLHPVSRRQRSQSEPPQQAPRPSTPTPASIRPYPRDAPRADTREGPRGTTRPSQNSTPGRAGSAFGNLCLGAAVFLLLAAAWTFLAGTIINPAIIGRTSVVDLRRAARMLTYIMFSGITLAGFLSGSAVVWRSGGATAHRGAVVLHAVSGPAAAIIGLLLLSYFKHLPSEPRSTAINAASAILGAVCATVLLTTRRPRSIDGSANGMALNGLQPIGLLLIISMIPSTGETAPWDGGPGPVPPSAMATSTQLNDIEAADCALSVQETKLTAAFTFFSIDAGPSWTFQQKELPDKKWQDTVDVGLRAGFKLVVGEHLLTKALGAKAGEGLSISAGSHATFEITSTYTDLPKPKADDVLRWSLNRYGLSALALPGLAELVLPTVQSQTAVRDVAPPTSSEVKLGGSINFDLEVAVGISYQATIDVGSDAAVALTNEKNTDTAYVSEPESVELAIGLTATGTGSAMAALGGGLSGTLSGDAVLSIGFLKQPLDLWVPESVKLESTYKMTGAGEMEVAGKRLLTAGADPQSVLGRIVKAAKAADTEERGGSLELTGSVDVLHHPEVLYAAVAVVNAAQKLDRRTSTVGDQARYHRAVNKLAGLVDQTAVLRGKVYAVTAGVAGIDIEAGDGLAFGASVEGESTAEILVGGFYRDPAKTWLASASCKHPL